MPPGDVAATAGPLGVVTGTVELGGAVEVVGAGGPGAAEEGAPVATDPPLGGLPPVVNDPPPSALIAVDNPLPEEESTAVGGVTTGVVVV